MSHVTPGTGERRPNRANGNPVGRAGSPSLANKSRFVCRAKVAFRVKVPREGGVHVGFLQTSLFHLGSSFASVGFDAYNLL